MDDLKLFTKDDNDLEGLLQTVKKICDDTGMSFGLDKFAKATFKRKFDRKNIDRAWSKYSD